MIDNIVNDTEISGKYVIVERQKEAFIKNNW
jgi:hypothetical protein